MRLIILMIISVAAIFTIASCKVINENTDNTEGQSPSYTYNVVDTGVQVYYDNTAIISTPSVGQAFYGQDATYSGNQPSYTDNGDGTITDNITELIWSKAVDLNKVTLVESQAISEAMTLGGYNDWRVPTIKELYSLILFTGNTGFSQNMQTVPANAIPFIDTNYFNFEYGDVTNNERYIDAQWLTSTKYTSTTMNGDETLFGVNFADGRIKGYGYTNPNNLSHEKLFYARYVRSNTLYGTNDFVDNDDGTISDNATGLMWQQNDDGTMRDWENALSYAENLTLAGYSDWRLPNAKELQSIVDYTRCPDITNSPAIDPIFSTTEINDPNGNLGQYPYFWTGTTHLDGVNPYSGAVYIAFGEAQGKMNGILMDVHGAGAQRSDPKSGNANDYPEFFGPQGDVRYVYNTARCVRNIE